MAIFYMAFGFLIAFTNALSQHIRQNRMLVGCIMLAYGIFRLVKIVLDIKRLNQEEKGFFEGQD